MLRMFTIYKLHLFKLKKIRQGKEESLLNKKKPYVGNISSVILGIPMHYI
jgi:hypothetical protein